MPRTDAGRDHPWEDGNGDPWSLDSETDSCFECGGTPDSHPPENDQLIVTREGLENIRAEAHAQGRAEARAAIEALPEWRDPIRPTSGWLGLIDRAAVLAAIDNLETP